VQLVQLFEPDMSQVLYILGQWQLLVDFTLVYVEVLPCDYYLFGSLGDSIYKKNRTYTEDDFKGNIRCGFSALFDIHGTVHH
jgi:hypothetical protein